MKDKQKIQLKLIVSKGKCSICNHERILYFTYNNVYGEKIITDKDGIMCAYADLFEENIVQELNELCKQIFQEQKVDLSNSRLMRIVSNIYGITCDSIDGKEMFSISNTKCTNCLEGKMIEDKFFGERKEVVLASKVTHMKWNNVNSVDKKKYVVKELMRQKYIL